MAGHGLGPIARRQADGTNLPERLGRLRGWRLAWGFIMFLTHCGGMVTSKCGIDLFFPSPLAAADRGSQLIGGDLAGFCLAGGVGRKDVDGLQSAQIQ